MITREFAEKFAEHLISAWNSHDLAQVLSHYADDFGVTSPYNAQIAGEPSGRLKGRSAVGAYWATALDRIADARV